MSTTTRTMHNLASLEGLALHWTRVPSHQSSLAAIGLWRLVSSPFGLVGGLLSFCYEFSAILFQICRSTISRSSTTMNKIGSEVFLVISCVVDLASC